MGVVLLFSKERGRKRGHLDWTRRWGVISTYVTLLLSAVPILFITALVLEGIAALFMSMPLKYQPGVTPLFVDASTAYVRYGPYAKEISVVVLVAFSSITILLACVPLFDALRSSGPKRLAASLLAPLALFSLMNLAIAGQHCVGMSRLSPEEFYSYQWYFRPEVIGRDIAVLPWGLQALGSLSDLFVELAKWCIALAIAIWLSIAQFAAWRQGEKAKIE